MEPSWFERREIKPKETTEPNLAARKENDELRIATSLTPNEQQ